MNPSTRLMIEKLTQLAGEGLGYQEAADRLGVSYHYVASYVSRFGIPLVQRQRGRKKFAGPTDRSRQMAALYQSGSTLERIGQTFGVTRERVRQIIKKFHGLTAPDGGQSFVTKRRKQERASKMDMAFMSKLGCDFSEYKKIRALGRQMMKSGSSRERTPMGAFICQRSNARRRGIGWELTFWQWWTVWQKSGHWHERRRGNGYVMCRNGDAGPYALGNIFIATSQENVCNSKVKKSGLPMGVRRGKRSGYVAQRQINGETFKLGTFPTPELAHAAYLAFVPPQQSEAA